MSDKYRILVVDDDDEMLRVISRWLALRDCSVITARDGTEGLSLASGEKAFQIVLTDLNMPKMDGLTMAEKIKEISPLTCIVLITGVCSGEVEKNNKINNIDRVLYKPFSLKNLDDAVDEIVNKNQAL